MRKDELPVFYCQRYPLMKICIRPTRLVSIDGMPMTQTGLTVQFQPSIVRGVKLGVLRVETYPEKDWSNIILRLRSSQAYGAQITEESPDERELLEEKIKLQREAQVEINNKIELKKAEILKKKNAKRDAKGLGKKQEE